MKPTILKVYSTYPKTSYDIPKSNTNSVVTISHFDSNDQYQIKPDSLYNKNTLEFHNDIPLYKFDVVSNEDYVQDLKKNCNVLDDYNKFQQQRNSVSSNKKTGTSVIQSQQMSSFERPNYSYTQLIYMAIESTQEKALTVSDIYSWCENHFPYYAQALNGWKNSLRHNLSINKCFKKITKLGIGGRGSLWVIDPREKHHLVSTMNRSNITSFKQQASFQSKPMYLNPPLSEELLQESYDPIEEVYEHVDDLNNIDEKPRQEWTDTRLDQNFDYSFSPSSHSITSETDNNDWQRSISSLVPMYPVKTHWYEQCLETICPLPDHNYCVPDLDELLNNPSLMTRHSFFSSNNQIETFSASSDFNDDDWPQTPSPISLQSNDLHYNFSEPVMSFIGTDTDDNLNSVSRKRGRSRKNDLTIKIPRNEPFLAPKIENQRPRNNQKERINNMYNLNTFFNSL